VVAERRARSVLVTGASGYIGRLFLERLASSEDAPRTIVAVDVRPTPPADRLPGVQHATEDVRSPQLAELMREHGTDTVVHLAFVVTPGKESTRELQYSVDVLGTQNVLDACLAAKVEKIVVTSSGAAYGYHADNPIPLTESEPLRGNEEFAYSHHKRLVEEMLARYREEHPELQQLVFRVCAILGERASNQLTALFERPFVLDVPGSRSGFVFIWDEDLVGCLLRGVHAQAAGVYNVAADGEMSVREIARILEKPYLPVPAGVLRALLRVLHPLGLSPYGPEQTTFLQYRPVLSNERLKSEFGYRPRLSTEEVFRHYLRAKQGSGGG
jgi:UDP-glucose 4-epimerase